MIVFRRRVAESAIDFYSHDRIDIDEVTALVLVMEFGTEEFVAQFAAGGEIYLGIGGGPFDEHVLPENDKRTCSDLMAEALGISGKKEVLHILNFVRLNDNEGVGNKSWISTVIKNLHDHVFPKAPVRVVNWAVKGIKAKLLDPANGDFSIDRICNVMESNPAKFHSPYYWFKTGEEAMEMAQLHFILELENIKNGKHQIEISRGPEARLSLAAAITGSPEACKAARYLGFDVFIQMNDSGNCQIFTNKKKKIDLRDVARLLNIFEQRSEGVQKIFDPRTLEQSGFPYVGAKWFYFKKGQAIFNGSLTHPAPPTNLTFEQVIGAAIIGLNQEKFHSDFKHNCKRGECAGRKCPYYGYGLLRCRGLRHTASLLSKRVAAYN